MPNWCENRVYLVGAPAEIDAVLAACAGPAYPETGRMPRTSERLAAMRTNAAELVAGPEGPFAFATIRPTPWADRSWVPTNFLDRGPWGYGRLGPDAEDTDIQRLAPGVARVRFDTAWSPPSRLVEIVAARFPGLLAVGHVYSEPGNGAFGECWARWGAATEWRDRDADAGDFDDWHDAHFGYVLTNYLEEDATEDAPAADEAAELALPAMATPEETAEAEDAREAEHAARRLQAVYAPLGADAAGTVAACTAWLATVAALTDGTALQRAADAFRRAHRVPRRALAHLLARHAGAVPPSVVVSARLGDWGLVDVLTHRTPRDPVVDVALTQIATAWLARARPQPSADRLSVLHRAWGALAADALLPSDAGRRVVSAATRWARATRQPAAPAAPAAPALAARSAGRSAARSAARSLTPAEHAEALVALAEVAMTIPTLTAADRSALLATCPPGADHARIRGMLVHHPTVTPAEAAVLLGLAPTTDGVVHPRTLGLWQAIRRDLAWWADPARRRLLLDARAPDAETLLAGAESQAARGEPAEAALRLAAALALEPHLVRQLGRDEWEATRAYLPVEALGPAFSAADGEVRQCAMLLSARCGAALIPSNAAPGTDEAPAVAPDADAMHAGRPTRRGQ